MYDYCIKVCMGFAHAISSFFLFFDQYGFILHTYIHIIIKCKLECPYYCTFKPYMRLWDSIYNRRLFALWMTTPSSVQKLPPLVASSAEHLPLYCLLYHLFAIWPSPLQIL